MSIHDHLIHIALIIFGVSSYTIALLFGNYLPNTPLSELVKSPLYKIYWVLIVISIICIGISLFL